MAKKTKIKRSYGGASAPDRARERREKLIAAGFELIGRKGFKAATVRAVCAEADLTQRYYYEAFSDAEDMLIEIYHRQLLRIESTLIQAALGPGNIAEKPAQVLDAFLTLLEQDPRIGRVVFFEILGVSPKVDKIYLAGSEKFVGLIAASLIPFLSKLAKPLNAELLARAAVGGVIHVATHWQLSNFATSKQKIIDNLTTILEIADEKQKKK